MLEVFKIDVVKVMNCFVYLGVLFKKYVVLTFGKKLIFIFGIVYFVCLVIMWYFVLFVRLILLFIIILFK